MNCSILCALHRAGFGAAKKRPYDFTVNSYKTDFADVKLLILYIYNGLSSNKHEKKFKEELIQKINEYLKNYKLILVIYGLEILVSKVNNIDLLMYYLSKIQNLKLIFTVENINTFAFMNFNFDTLNFRLHLTSTL